MGVKIKLILFFTVIGVSISAQLFAQNYFIPEQEIFPNQLLDRKNWDLKIHIDSFEISRQVTLKEYKDYLNVIKNDSGEIAYLNRLPDSSIGPKHIYEKYFNTTEYDHFPVVGISWDNILSYCKWLTLKNNMGDTLNVIYRLPNLYEYLSATEYLKSQKVNTDFDTLFSDWLMDAYDESVFSNEEPVGFGYYYFHTKNEFKVLRRKAVVGQSFLYRYNSFMRYYGYADEGYRHIGFRIVMDKNAESFERLSRKTYRNNEYIPEYENALLRYWNLKPELKK